MRTIILADVHANYAALSAVLEVVAHEDTIFCLGDLVLYGPNPKECIDLIRSRKIQVVRGNHDDEIVKLTRQPAETLDKSDDIRWKQWSAGQLCKDQIDYLARLPEEIEQQWDGCDVRLRHDLPLPGELIFPDTPMERIESRMDAKPCDFMFVGHVHVPYILKLPMASLIDVGSVGQSEHGGGGAWYALWEEGTVTFHQVPYDVEQTIADLKRVPLSPSYIELWSDFWRKGYVDRAALALL